jgi:hypothetical protein
VPWADLGDTIDHGIRRNFNETAIRTGAVLAVGDSFTEGWDVNGFESWPAALEEITGVPVLNAGIGAYGTDQIIMRAEQLLPVAKPKILIVGFFQDDIFRTGHTVFGAPKPHFTLENGALRFHPPGPFERRDRGNVWSSLGSTLRDGLSYLALADYVLSRLARDYWYGTDTQRFLRHPDIDEVAVTCALLRRLKQRADQEGIRTTLFMQYSAQSILASDKPLREAQAVMACAANAGMRVIDQFPILREIAEGDPEVLSRYYVFHDRNYGHMSVLGNWHTARLLSRELHDWLQAVPAAD